MGVRKDQDSARVLPVSVLSWFCPYPQHLITVDDVDDPLPAPPTTAALARSKDILATWAPAEEQSRFIFVITLGLASEHI
ncbi:hypothetical protein PNOK_0719800 [Pyrrhoderma noxium]|uniref:Uncharacterized protein n=1 Tax=Pyrrhoderma noxium TaxID=2282107 RepID=A0A286UC85_9AGAM|nr:hypothetical protein PNOK_0719800 [Pyrrhoderma noxium]